MVGYNGGMYIHSTCAFCGEPVIRHTQSKSANVKIHFCNNDCKSEWQKLQKPVTKEWLYEHYVTKGLDCSEIGRMVSRDPKSVWNWLKGFGIPTRPRGSDKRQQIKKGAVSFFKGKKHSQETKDRIRAISIATGRVPYNPEIGSYMKGKKGASTPNWKGGVTPERNAFYSTPEWKKVVPQVWKRDNAICQRCKLDHRSIPVSERGTFDIHHIVSFEVKELRCVLSNLILLCEKCHYWVHSNENVNKEFIREE